MPFSPTHCAYLGSSETGSGVQRAGRGDPGGKESERGLSVLRKHPQSWETSKCWYFLPQGLLPTDFSASRFCSPILFTLFWGYLCLRKDLLDGNPSQNTSSLVRPSWNSIQPRCYWEAGSHQHSPSSALSHQGSARQPLFFILLGMSCAPVTKTLQCQGVFPMILRSPPHLAWRRGREAGPPFPALTTRSPVSPVDSHHTLLCVLHVHDELRIFQIKTDFTTS